MKKVLRFIIVMVVLIVAMMATVPSPEKHRAMLEEKLIEKSEKNPGWLNRLVNKAAIKLIVSQTGIQDCYVFNLSYLPQKETNEYISIGVFNHVFLFVKARTD